MWGCRPNSLWPTRQKVQDPVAQKPIHIQVLLLGNEPGENFGIVWLAVQKRTALLHWHQVVKVHVLYQGDGDAGEPVGMVCKLQGI